MKTVEGRRKPDFFYEGGGRSNVLHQIQHCLQFSPGVVVLTGPTGSGRSSIIHALVGALRKDDSEVCVLTEESAVLETEEELYRALAEGFGLEEKSIEILEDLVGRVQHFIQLGLRSKRTMLIVIDDAKQHSDEVLESLLLLVARTKGLTLLLSGESLLFDTLQQFQIRSVLMHQVALRPLLAEESFEFLRQYLLQYDIPDQALLNRKRQDELMTKTGGNLSLLVREAQQLISDAAVKVNLTYASFPVLHAVALIAVIAVTLLAYFYYPDTDQNTRNPHLIQKITNADTVVDSAAILSDQHDLIVSAVNSQDKKTPDGIERTSSVSNPDIEPQSSRETVTHKSEINTGQTNQIYTDREQALLNRPSHNVTLQLMSLSSEKMAERFVDQSTIADKSSLNYYRRTTAKGTSYVVLYGDYSDRQKAAEAQQNLPASLKVLAPWVRPMADIQSELRQRE